MKQLLAAIVCLACAYPVLVGAEEPKPAAPAAGAKTPAEAFKCEAGCSKCTYKITAQCMPAIKVNDVVYIVKVSDNASDATKKLVATLPEMKEGPAKSVKIVGKILPAADSEKAAVAAKTEHKFWFEVGEMTVDN